MLATTLEIANNKEQRLKKKKRSGKAAPSTEETSGKLFNEEFQRVPKGGREHSICYRSSGTANLRSEISHIKPPFTEGDAVVVGLRKPAELRVILVVQYQSYRIF